MCLQFTLYDDVCSKIVFISYFTFEDPKNAVYIAISRLSKLTRYPKLYTCFLTKSTKTFCHRSFSISAKKMSGTFPIFPLDFFILIDTQKKIPHHLTFYAEEKYTFVV